MEQQSAAGLAKGQVAQFVELGIAPPEFFCVFTDRYSGCAVLIAVDARQECARIN